MDGIEHARAELSQRLITMGSRVARGSCDELANEIEAIRRLALANGMLPAASVAHALEMALGRGERGPLIDGWLAILRDAVVTDRTDAAACDAFAAACSVRLTG